LRRIEFFLCQIEQEKNDDDAGDAAQRYGNVVAMQWSEMEQMHRIGPGFRASRLPGLPRFAPY